MSFLSQQARKVPSIGPDNANIVLVGEAPSDKELQQLEPFVGPAGGILDDCLGHARLVRSEVRITNVFPFKIVKKRDGIYHPESKELLYSEKYGLTEAAEPYIEKLYDEIVEVDPNIIVPLGNLALRVLARKQKIHKWRGSLLKVAIGPRFYKALPTIHPGAVLQGSPLDKYTIAADFKYIKKECKTAKVTPLEQNFTSIPSFEESLRFLEYYRQLAEQGFRINYDIEIVNGQIDCLSLAVDMHNACSISLRWEFTEKERQIAEACARIFELPNGWFCNENLLFDITVLGFKSGIMHRVSTQKLDDPMTANHIIYPDFPKSLAFLTSIHTPIPYYKDDGKAFTEKGAEKLGGIEERRRYNCQDSCASIASMQALDRELDYLGYRKQYEDTMSLYPVLATIMIRGIKVDKEKLEEARVELEAERDRLQNELDNKVGFHLNPRSEQQCQNYFYTLQGIRPFTRGGGRITTDEKAMARLAKGTSTRRPLPEASLVIRIRKLSKLLSAYFSIQLDEDSRLRASYNPRGTTTGRLSSSQTIFGTGHNLQNIPEGFRQFLTSDPGYILVEIDKAGAEWFVVAYVARDARMMEVHQKNLDPHARTAELITGVPVDLIKKESKVAKHETDPDVLYEKRKEYVPEIFDAADFLPQNMPCRQAGKHSNHGLNYGMRPDGFSLQNEIPLNEAKLMWNKYHEAYPNVQNRLWNYVERRMAQDRTLENLFGHKRRFLQPSGHKLFLAAYDYIPQSTVGWMLNFAMRDAYHSTHPALKRMELLANVHDSTLVQFPLDIGYERLSQGIEELCHLADPELEFQGGKFRIGTNVKLGFNWRDMVELSREENNPARIENVISNLE